MVNNKPKFGSDEDIAQRELAATGAESAVIAAEKNLGDARRAARNARARLKRAVQASPAAMLDRELHIDIMEGITRGTINMNEALAARYSDGRPVVRDREHFLAICVDNEDFIPF